MTGEHPISSTPDNTGGLLEYLISGVDHLIALVVIVRVNSGENNFVILGV